MNDSKWWAYYNGAADWELISNDWYQCYMRNAAESKNAESLAWCERFVPFSNLRFAHRYLRTRLKEDARRARISLLNLSTHRASVEELKG